MILGALGDIHGDFAAAARIMRRHAEVPFWISVGDVGDDIGLYETPPSPLHWIKGNNEDFDFIDDLVAGVESVPNLHYIPNGTDLRVHGVRIAGLGGTFAPTWYETAPADLPRPPRRAARGMLPGPSALRGDKRRHFVREEVARCQGMRHVDIFLSHEAPRPFMVGKAGGRGMDAGKTPINDILKAMQPRLHLFGHHHRFSDATRQGVRSICLDLVSRSYLLIDSRSWEYERRDA